jgi:glucose-1-phosphate thymidylyltransferase
VLKNCHVRGPAVIGENCIIEETYIGPFTSIGDNTKVTHAEIEFSILRENCQVIDFGGRIEASLIGTNVELTRGHRKPVAYSFMLGDDSKVEIP